MQFANELHSRGRLLVHGATANCDARRSHNLPLPKMSAEENQRREEGELLDRRRDAAAKRGSLILIMS